MSQLKWIKVVLVLLVLCTSVLMTGTTQAGVNLKNGNFYVSYTDLMIGGGSMITIERTYNSRSTEFGIFGYGWGSDYETILMVNRDGSVTIHENGAGASTLYYRRGHRRSDSEKASKEIADHYRMMGMFSSEEHYQSFLIKIMKNAELRRAHLNVLVAQGVMKHNEIPLHTKLYSSQRASSYILKTNHGFRRVYDDGRSEVFSQSGLLMEVREPHRYVQLRRNQGGDIVELVDHLNNRVRLFYNANGTVRAIKSGQKTSVYKYNGMKLVQSIDIANNNYQYEYDDNYNMTAIRYTDGTDRLMSYNDRSFIKLVKTREGHETHYSYYHNNANDYGTISQRKNNDGEVVSESSYHYQIGVTDTGRRYTSRVDAKTPFQTSIKKFTDDNLLYEEVIDGVVNEYKYENRFITRYTRDGHVYDVIRDEVYNKISRIETSGNSTDEHSWRKFSYDNLSNLILVEASDGTEIGVIYQDSKVKEINRGDVKISFNYDDNDEISAIQWGDEIIDLENLDSTRNDVLFSVELEMIDFIRLIHCPNICCSTCHPYLVIMNKQEVLETALTKLTDHVLKVKKDADLYYKRSLEYRFESIFISEESEYNENWQIQGAALGNADAMESIQKKALSKPDLYHKMAYAYLYLEKYVHAQEWFHKTFDVNIPAMNEKYMVFLWYAKAMQEHENSKQEIKEYLANLTWRSDRYSLKVLRYIDDIINKETLLKHAKSDNDKQIAHFCIAIKALEAADAQKALVHLSKIKIDDDNSKPEAEIARMLIQKLDVADSITSPNAE